MALYRFGPTLTIQVSTQRAFETFPTFLIAYLHQVGISKLLRRKTLHLPNQAEKNRQERPQETKTPVQRHQVQQAERSTSTDPHRLQHRQQHGSQQADPGLRK